MSAVTIEPAADRGRRERRGEPFFFKFALAITLVVFSGFIVNAVVNWQDMDRFTLPIFLHGAFSAAWYLLLLTQLRLVAGGRLALHRKLGAASILIALVIIIGGPVMSLDLYRDILASPEFDAASQEDLAGLASLIGGTFMQWFLFAALYVLGLLNRKRAVHHKRLMIATAIQMSPAAVSRWLGVFGLPGPLALVIILGLYGVLAVYDWRTDRRIHWSTLVGAGAFVSLVLSFFFVFTQQPWIDFVGAWLGYG